MSDRLTDPDGLEASLEEAASVRRQLDEVLWPRFKRLKEIFTLAFNHGTSRTSVSSRGTDRETGRGNAPGAVLKLISDLLYYRGGYPLPSSPPRMNVLARQTAEAVRFLHVAGHLHEFREQLQAFGVDVICHDKEKFKVTLKDNWLVNAELRKMMQEFDLPATGDTTPSVLMKSLLDECLALQGEICGTSNQVKKGIYSKVVQTNPDLKKPDFLELVKVRVLAEDAEVKHSSAAKLHRKVTRKVANTHTAYRGLKVASKVKTTTE